MKITALASRWLVKIAFNNRLANYTKDWKDCNAGGRLEAMSMEDLTDRFFLDGWARRLGSWPAIKTAPTAILQSTDRESHGELIAEPLAESSCVA